MSRRRIVTTAVAPLLGVLALAFAAPASSQDDLAALRNQMAEQRALIQAQQRQLEQQAQELERLSQRLESMAASKGDATASLAHF